MALRKDSSQQEMEQAPCNWLFPRLWELLPRIVPYEVEAAREQNVQQLTNELAEERAQCASLVDQLNEAIAKLSTVSDSNESLRAELAKQRDNCSKLKCERNAERKKSANLENQLDLERRKSADLENQLKQPRDKQLPHALFKGCGCLFAPTRNYDFRNVSDAGMTFSRGGVRYNRPMGSMRYALEVANRYDDKDWLQDGVGGWAVAYHGTTRENAVSIIRNGFHLSKGTRFGYGTGVYCTPDPNTAKTRYAKNFIENGKTCLVVIQVRVKPGRYTVAWPGDGVQGAYWLVPDTADIRPYGLCVYGI
ncbi:hypothetical protein AAVH_27551 [Aphelenchoides avenae]|nr:hypothetical protein AAVH_27551 [Aphelenchus avenae]